MDRCFVLSFSSLDSFLPFLVLFVGVGTELCGSSVSSCPRVQLGCHGALVLNPRELPPRDCLKEREAGLCRNTPHPQDHNLDLGSVLHMTSDPGDPISQKQCLNPSSTNTVDFTVANVALSWASSVHAQPLSGGPHSVPSTDDRPLCASAEHHEAPGCWREDLQMAHMEEGTERNLHSALWPHGVQDGPHGGGGGGRGMDGVVRQPGTPTSGPGRRRRASEWMGTRPLRWTYGHSRQERLTSKGATQVHSSKKTLTSKGMDTHPLRRTHVYSDGHTVTPGRRG